MVTNRAGPQAVMSTAGADPVPLKKARGRKPKLAGALGDLPAISSAGAILDAAIALISSRNYSSVTVKDIAAAADVNVALIYYYYSSKENLFLSLLNAMLARAADRFRALADPAIPPREALQHWAEVHASEFRNVQTFMRLCLDYANGQERSAAIDRVISGYYEQEEVVLRGIIAAGVERGDFRPVDVYQEVRLASAMIDGVLVRDMITPVGTEERDIRAALALWLDHLARVPEGA